MKLNGFHKSERLNSRTVIDKLFAGGNGSYAVFPLRVVFVPVTDEEAHGMMEGVPAAVLISVPKRRFHHAVDRNRMKRLVREAYRTNKHILWDALEGKNLKLAIAFICITDTMPTQKQVEKAVRKSLVRIKEEPHLTSQKGRNL